MQPLDVARVLSLTTFIVACPAGGAAMRPLDDVQEVLPRAPQSDRETDSLPLLVVLTETGRARQGYPVFEHHPNGEDIARQLRRGFPGRWLRLYRWEQNLLAAERAEQREPAYLLLSSNQGGFARKGFWLGDEDKRNASYVDIYRSHPLSGRFGAVDQILPHELAHVVIEQLLDGLPHGRSNQVHALGVKTDPVTAFNEGLAESLQVLAIDDPDADPGTRALGFDLRQKELAERQMSEYGRELNAVLTVCGRRRITFPFWFSGSEQVHRYHAVKENLFAFEPVVPDRLLSPSRIYEAYLFESTQPGRRGAKPKPPAVMLSTEAVVSHLMYRWASDGEIGERYLPEDFYRRFGARREDVGRIENAYLKIFHAVSAGRPADTASLVEVYRREFPEEAGAVDRIVREALLGRSVPAQPQIWLANAAMETGTSLFDQYRRVPRVHTFDLNAATLVDLIGVPGVERGLAEAILRHAPYESVDGLRSVPGITETVVDTFAEMEKDMDVMEEPEGVFTSGLLWLLAPYAIRAFAVFVLATIAGSLSYRAVRRRSATRAMLNAAAAAFLVLFFGWLVEGVPAPALPLLPVAFLGIPGALWRFTGRGQAREAAGVLAAWAAAALPASALARSWF
ncbi:MAG: ComEA family DNA-binding protein [Vicinamibacterales bacterium]